MSAPTTRQNQTPKRKITVSFQSIKAPSAPAAATPIILPTPVSTAPFLVAVAALLEALLALELTLALFDTLAALVLAALTAVLLTDEADLLADAGLVALPPVEVEADVMVAALASPVAIFKTSLCTLAAKDLMSLGSPAYQLFVETLDRSPLKNDCCHFVWTAVDATLATDAYSGSAVTWAMYELTFDAAAPVREAKSTLWAAAVVARIATRV